MATVKVDIIDGASVRQTADGIEAARIAFVHELSGSTSQRMYEAIQATPAIGAAHPSIPDIRLDEKSAEPQGHAEARVTLIYRTPQFGGGDVQVGDTPQITIGGSLQAKDTQRDNEGNFMTLIYSPTAEEVANGEVQNLSFPVIATARIQVPQVFVRYRRRENASPGVNAKRFVGKANSTSVFSDEPKMWLCTQIVGDSNDNGLTYVTTYEFQRADTDKGWMVTLIAEKDGKPMAADKTEGIHFKDFDVYGYDDFNDLGL